MSALPPDQMRAIRQATERSNRPLDELVAHWHNLHDQAAQLARSAQLAPESAEHAQSAFAHLLGKANAWQCEIARQGIADIDAIMQPGLTALNILTARGLDAAAPALALWREFHAARNAVLAVLQSGPGQEELSAD